MKFQPAFVAWLEIRQQTKEPALTRRVFLLAHGNWKPARELEASKSYGVTHKLPITHLFNYKNVSAFFKSVVKTIQNNLSLGC